MFRCRACRQACNERTNTPYNHLQVHTDIAVLVVPGRLQDKLSLRNVAEMVLTRGFTFTHETAPVWEERFAPLLTARLKARRRGKAGRTWHVDETDVKVAGRWCSLYRAINADGNLVETMLSKTRDMEAAKRFFAYALQTVGQAPEKVTTDGHDSYPRAVRETLGPNVCHGASRSMNNRIEQDHGASSSAPIPCAGSGPSTLPPDSARPMTNSVTTSARAPASTTPSLLLNNAACSRSAGERCARCSRRPNHPGPWSPSAHRRLTPPCPLRPDASLRKAVSDLLPLRLERQQAGWDESKVIETACLELWWRGGEMWY